MEQLFFSKENFNIIYNILKKKLIQTLMLILTPVLNLEKNLLK